MQTIRSTEHRTNDLKNQLDHTISPMGRQRGQGMTEYIIIVALIAVAAIGAFTFFGQTIRSQTAGIAKEVAGQDAGTQITAAGTAAGKADTQATTNKGLKSYNGNEADK
jgi:Flp pilus assembly pilin Flp